MAVEKIIKRNGEMVDFDESKIFSAVFKAGQSVGKDGKMAESVTKRVVEKINSKFKDRIPSVEEIQDIVEETLIEMNHSDVAKSYILYRQRRREIREEKKKILNKKTLDPVDKRFSLNALRVLASRYLRKNENLEVIESPAELFRRVAVNVAISDVLHDPVFYDKSGSQPARKGMDELPDLSIGKYQLNAYHKETLKRTFDVLNSEGKMKVDLGEIVEKIRNGDMDRYEQTIDRYYSLMIEQKFMPNTPALVNFGNPLGMGSACFVLDIDDSLESIMSTLRDASMVFKSGGGCGYNFSKLRPEGDIVMSTKGVASGPISFMQLYDVMTEVIKQGGVRRGANMGILNINHPDIEKFIKAKEGNKQLRNFNISVLIDEKFWECLEKGEMYPLVNPRTGETVREVDPKTIIDMIAYYAWDSAEPGVLFRDNINKRNPLREALGDIVTTNPCGEVLLYPNESCNLGSINVHAFFRDGDVDWDSLADAVRTATRFLDNIIDVNRFPLEKIREMTRRTRKIGLGVMGVADLLFEMGIQYDSEEGLRFMEKLMEFINYHSKKESIKLAIERGPFPLFGKSSYVRGEMPFDGFYEGGELDWKAVSEEVVEHGIRNAYTTVIAPTGSISMIADTSSGIEPVFSLVFEKNVTVGRFFYIDSVFERKLKERGLYSDELMSEISENGGSLDGIDLPEDMKRVFRTAMDISPEYHIRAQAAFQKWVDSSISKTINLPNDATPDDIREAYLLAHRLGCKGVTVYRDGSISGQVLKTKRKKKVEVVVAQPSASDESKCPVCGVPLVYEEGCYTCKSCGYGKCS